MSSLRALRAVIQAIPVGRVISYGQAAATAGFPGAARLTVRALQGSNHLPWHRVVGAGGRIALPGAEGREQRLRLEVEGVTFRGGRVRMDLHVSWPKRRRKRRSATAELPASRAAVSTHGPSESTRSWRAIESVNR